MEGSVAVQGSVVKGVDSFKLIGDKTGLDKFNQDSYVNAFAVWKLSGDDKKEYYRPSGLRWSDYTIEFAQFCQQPLLEHNLDVGHAVIDALDRFQQQLLPTRKEGKTDDELLKLLGLSKADISQKKWLPSPHHRFIRFRTGQCYTNSCSPKQPKVWGIMERGLDGVICALYKSERESLRREAKVVQVGYWFTRTLEMSGLSVRLEEVYRNVGGRWRERYHLLNNNCIHYALECWKKLGDSVSWDDIADGHATYPSKYNPCAPVDSSDSRNSSCSFI